MGGVCFTPCFVAYKSALSTVFHAGCLSCWLSFMLAVFHAGCLSCWLSFMLAVLHAVSHTVMLFFMLSFILLEYLFIFVLRIFCSHLPTSLTEKLLLLVHTKTKDMYIEVCVYGGMCVWMHVWRYACTARYVCMEVCVHGGMCAWRYVFMDGEM